VRVFISWSGQASREVADALNDWLPEVIQAVKPWISPSIEKGARWANEIAERLDEIDFGIVCLTPSNLSAPWINFEAGALSSPMTNKVATALLGLSAAEVPPPLGQFNHTTVVDKGDVRKLVGTLNAELKDVKLDDRLLDKAFERCWPDLEQRLGKIDLTEEERTPDRSLEDMMRELLELARNNSRSFNWQDFVSLPGTFTTVDVSGTSGAEALRSAPITPASIGPSRVKRPRVKLPRPIVVETERPLSRPQG